MVERAALGSWNINVVKVGVGGVSESLDHGTAFLIYNKQSMSDNDSIL
jgi:hypothetical protein